MKNRLFFFGNYDGYTIRNGSVPSFYSLPTAAERNGDFSALPTPIYDPKTQVCTSNGVCSRSQFPNNVIPQSELDPVAQKLEAALPAPMNSNLQNNFLSAFTGGADQNNFTIKIDANATDKNHLYFVSQFGKAYPVALGANNGPQLPLPYGSSRYADTITTLFQLSDSQVISSNLVNVFGFSFNRFNNPYISPTAGQGWAAKVGLTGLPSGQASDVFPPISFNGPNSPTGWALTEPSIGFTEITNTETFQDSIQWVRGRHSLTFGGQLTLWQDNNSDPLGGSNINYINFNNNETASVGADGTVNTNTGNSYASFLVGAVDGSQLVDDTPAPEVGARWKQGAIWAQDDWKVTKKLSLNLGLRWDVFTPYVEQYNRQSWLNPSIPNPAAGGYPGALQFAGNGPDSCHCSTRVPTDYRNFGPRVGFAYQADKKTVLRGAYGINYIPSGSMGGDSARQGSGLNGYGAVPSFSSPNSGITPAFYLANGFPSYTHPPYFDSGFGAGFNAASPFNASGITYDAPEIGGKPAYTQNWNATLQRQLDASTVLTVSYAASNSHRLPTGVGRGIYSDQIDPRYLALGGLLNSPATPANLAAADAIIPGIGLPYSGFQGSIGQALRPFPQYSGVNDQWGDIGNATYNALEVSAQRRMSHGLTFLVSFTLSKEIDDAGSILGGFFGASGRTAYNNRLEKSIGYQDIPKQLVLSYTYDIPVGKGHSLGAGNRIVSALVSNWRFAGIQSYVQGTPLGQAPIGANCNVPYTGGCYADYNPNFSGSVRINGNYGSGPNILGPNPTSFIAVGAFQNPAAYTFGNTPRSLAYGLRNPPLLDEDFSLHRDIKITERFTFRLQADVFNAFNRTVFGGISTNINSANFGQVSSQANSPRQFQFDGSIRF